MAAKVKKGDQVIVLTGRNKRTQGEVLKVMPDEGRIVVRGVNIVKRHTKPTQDDPQGGIRTFEAPIQASNVALIDPRDGKPTRVGFKTDEHGRKTRYAKRSGETLDV